MLSFPDLALVSGVALIVFGPERLPKVARQVGQAIGMVRSTANAFVAEMERAAAVPPIPTATPNPIPQATVLPDAAGRCTIETPSTVPHVTAPQLQSDQAGHHDHTVRAEPTDAS